MRVLITIPWAEHVQFLRDRKIKKQIVRSIRDAIKLYLVHNKDAKDWIARGAGYWKDRTDIGDAIEYQRAMREDRAPYEEL